jgi:hypothetical protein
VRSVWRLRLIALIEDAAVADRILRHLGLPTEIPSPRTARALLLPAVLSPPSWLVGTRIPLVHPVRLMILRSGGAREVRRGAGRRTSGLVLRHVRVDVCDRRLRLTDR